MPTFNSKCHRATLEQSSPRAVSKNLKKCPFSRRSSSPTSSSSQSPSPPRRRDAIKSTVINAIRGKSSTVVPQYRGVRHREELNKFVSEIRPTRCSKKIWLGTYDTAEEAARAFDIGNLCCNKNLPLNFEDSRARLKRISSQLSPEEARSAIAKLAKEVARLHSASPSSSGESPEPVNQAATLPHSEFVPCQTQTYSEFVPQQTYSEFVPYQAFQPQPEYQPLAQVQHFAAAGIHPDTYLEQLPEQVCAMEVATTMPVVERGNNGSRSWSFDLSIGDVSISEMSLPDDLSGIFNDALPDVIDNHMFEDHTYQDQSQDLLYQDSQLSGGDVFGEVYYYSL